MMQEQLHRLVTKIALSLEEVSNNNVIFPDGSIKTISPSFRVEQFSGGTSLMVGIFDGGENFDS